MASHTDSPRNGEPDRRRTLRRVRIPLLGPLLVLCVLAASSGTPTATTFAVGPIAYPWCSRNPHVPADAYEIEEFIRSHNGSPRPGFVGGRTFRDDKLKLPPWFGPFREYDVRAHVHGQDRDPERIVLGPQANAAWYTPDHYETFLEMHPWGCMPLLA